METSTGRKGSADQIFLRQSSKGGNPFTWHKLTPNNYQAVLEEWSRSINDDNLATLAFGKMFPIWELVAKQDQAKGMRVKSYLEGEWARRINHLRQMDKYGRATSEWRNVGCWKNFPRVWSHQPYNMVGRVGFLQCQKTAEQRKAAFFFRGSWERLLGA